jgi:hypothetical protein
MISGLRVVQRLLWWDEGHRAELSQVAAGEEAARKDLAKDWAKVPSAGGTQCIGTVNVGGSPSYVELLICREMMRDSRMHRQEEQTKAKQSSTNRNR